MRLSKVENNPCSFSLVSFRFLFWNPSLQRHPPSRTATHLHQPLWWRTQQHLNLAVTRKWSWSNQEAKLLLRLYSRHQHYQCPKSLPLSWLTFHPWVDPALATCLHCRCQIGHWTLHLWNSLALNLAFPRLNLVALKINWRGVRLNLQRRGRRARVLQTPLQMWPRILRRTWIPSSILTYPMPMISQKMKPWLTLISA